MDETANKQEKKKRTMNARTRKNIVLWLVIIAVVLGSSAIISIGSGKISHLLGIGPSFPDAYPYIGVLYVEGEITSGQTDTFGLPAGYQHQWTLDTIDDLIADDNNKALLIFVNSPGGGVYESDELYLKLKEYKETTGRPVYSAMGSMAASGGYYISAAADKIIANRNTWTGSIGVTIGTFYDISGFLEKNGINTITITSGANKAMGSMTQPMTEEQQQIFQALVDECYEQFTGIVADGRNMDIAKVKKLADGRIYTAKQALDLGLVDAIGTREEAIADLKKSFDLEDCDVVDITYENNNIFGKFLYTMIPDLPAGDASAILKFVQRNENSPVNYMFKWQ